MEDVIQQWRQDLELRGKVQLVPTNIYWEIIFKLKLKEI